MNEIQRLNNKLCCKSTKFKTTFADFPTTGKLNTLYVDKETGTTYIWDGDGYISTSDSLFMFQVGVPELGHIHFATLSKVQAQELIHGTYSNIPVGDPLQASVVITTESNGMEGDEHVHDLTIFFDYVSHTFIVTDISNNLLYNHEAHLVGGGGFLPLSGGTMEPGAQIFFDNTSLIQEGTTDAGTGGNGGIALRCSLGYEFKWEAGALYVLQQDGFTIRVTDYRLDPPTVNDDSSKGFVVGSIWRLDTGGSFNCIDATLGNAIWV